MDRLLTYTEAIREATAQEMARDVSVIVLGQGVDDPKAIYGTTRGLQEAFGAERVFDTPLAEDGMMGVAIGAAMAGLRPINVHIRMEFLLLAMNQLINIASKCRYMYGGTVCVPLVVRVVIGKSWGQGPQHSQALQAFFMHVPGLKVVAPSTPYDAKGCLIASIRDENPVIFVEQRMLHFTKSAVPEEGYTVPLGQARVLVPGEDVTLVGISYMAVECLRAQRYLQAVGIQAEVIDPVSLSPLDMTTIANSVWKTGHLVVVDNAWLTCGASAEIITQLLECSHGRKDFTVARMGFEPVPCPTTKHLENAFYPDARSIASFVHRRLRPSAAVWTPQVEPAREAVEFKGPF
jgi:pyruvate/2-oxoglutarate/acetoin dehydrogenase E1 component